MAENSKMNVRTPLSAADREKLVDKATCAMHLVFQDGNKFTKWSNEWKQPNKFVNINDSISEMFRIFDQYFRGSTVSGVIFDTRIEKKLVGHNKIWQFENGSWKQVQQFNW